MDLNPQPTSCAPTPEAVAKLINSPVTSANVAFNILVQFLVVGQKRGVFNFEEAAKIWECMKLFYRHEDEVATAPVDRGTSSSSGSSSGSSSSSSAASRDTSEVELL